MKRIIAAVLLCSVIAGATAGALTGCTTDIPELPEESTTPTETEQEPVRPQDDYYRYINGEKLANATFEYGGRRSLEFFPGLRQETLGSLDLCR